MNVQFSLEYKTTWGERMVLRLGKDRYDMDYSGPGRWSVTVPAAPAKEYGYELWRGEKCLRTEWRSHVLEPVQAETVLIRDRWLDRPGDVPFYSSLFTQSVFHRKPAGKKRTKGNVTLSFHAAQIRPGQAVAVSGSGALFADWKKVILLDDSCFPLWIITLPVTAPFAYKFLVVDRESLAPVCWEDGPNRLFADVPQAGTHLFVNDATPSFSLQPWKGAGTAIPVFSLRTGESFGIGEFHDIKKLVDWAVATGQNLLQLLPINDTTMTRTWEDSYPYNANSTFALHPQFIHLPDAGVRKDKAYKELQAELNALPQVDYERVNNEKERLLRKCYASRAEELAQSNDYQGFISDNKSWLQPYAVFCCLRDETGTPDFSQWGKMAQYSPRKVSAYAHAHPEAVGFYCFEQYLLDKQLREAVAYAHAHGVVLKGDLPIGISRTSVDAWQYPSLFHLDSQAGAPPDAFAADGQNWGFPTYNWEEMARDGFAWWKARMKKMSLYFDAFRIDHILGFFRIWEIPVPYKSGLMGHFSPALPYSREELAAMGFDLDAPGMTHPAAADWAETDVLFIEDPRKKGYFHPRISAPDCRAFDVLAPWQKERYKQMYEDFFYRRHNAFWKESAMAKLPTLVDSTAMLTCGEDLGMIPDCVPEVMRELGLLSLEIQRMPKSLDVEFGDPSRYPYACVCATGTHDTSPLRAWWEEDRAATQRYYNGMLHQGGEAPYYAEPWVCEMILRQHVASPAMLCVLPLQDWLSMDGTLRYGGNPSDERINVPAIPRYYWRYRMHVSLEQLLSDEDFSAHMKTLLSESGRGA